MSGYTNSFTANNGDLIEASLFQTEYQNLETAFNVTSGHTHTGNTGEGAFIPMISDTLNNAKIEIVTGVENEIQISSNFNNQSNLELKIQHDKLIPATTNTYDLGSATNGFKDIYVNGVGNFTNLKVGDPINQLITITDIFSDDNLSQNSSTALATQSSIKTYVDNAISNSNGIMRQSEFSYNSSQLQLTGSYAEYINVTINNVIDNSNIHIIATVSVEGIALSGNVGNINAVLVRDNTNTLLQPVSVLSTTDTSNTMFGSVSIVFRDDGLLAGNYTYQLKVGSDLMDTAIVNSGSLLVTEQIA